MTVIANDSGSGSPPFNELNVDLSLGASNNPNYPQTLSA
jgi:hypothetical protein